MSNESSKRLFSVLVVIASILCMAGQSSAQQLGNVSDAEAKERIAHIQKALDDGKAGAQAWWFGWIAAYGAATVVQGSVGYVHRNDFERNRSTYYRKVHTPEFSQDMMIGSVTTMLGVVGMCIDPFLPAYAPYQLEKIPGNTAQERREKLIRAEELLRKCAKKEKDGWGWLPHVLNLGVNIAAGLVTSLAYERPWTDGLLTFGIGEGISLVNIFTQPRRAIKDLKRYEDKYVRKTGYSDEYDTDWFVVFQPYPDHPVGIRAGIKF